MNESTPKHQSYLYVCEKQKPQPKQCCSSAGTAVYEQLNQLVQQHGLKQRVRVVRTQCMDMCSEGPIVMAEPQHIVFKKVETQDCERIVAHFMD